MPRSTKASARTSIASKRTSKRSASQQKDVYAIPESPQSLVASQTEDASNCTNEIDTTSFRSSSPAPLNRGRSMSTTSTKINEDFDCTPTQAKPTRSRTASLEPKQFHLPGFEALDAVNGLYRKIKDTQDENVRLKQENRHLAKEIQDYKKQIKGLQAELQKEKEETRTFRMAQEKINQAADKLAEQNLNTVLESLRNFGTAAYNLMPLLDILTDAPDIEYDEATEKLYEIMKQYKNQDGNSISRKVKTEPSRSRN